MEGLKAGCISCDIISGKIIEPGGTIYENACWHVGSILPPVIWRGFLIVKLKRHCEQIAGLTAPEAASLGPLLTLCSQALTEVTRPEKVYICSFGDGVRHIHFWILPRPPEVMPGMHAVFYNLDLRYALTRILKIRKWIVPDAEVQQLTNDLRAFFQNHVY